MKIIGVSISIFVILTGFNIVINIFSGLDLNRSITHIFDPFKVEDTVEFFLFCTLLVFFFAGPLLSFIQKRRKGSNEN